MTSLQDGQDTSSSSDCFTQRDTPHSSGINTPTTLEQDHQYLFDPAEVELAFQLQGQDQDPTAKDDGNRMCALLPDRQAVWVEAVTGTKLSGLAAAALVNGEVFGSRRLAL